MKYILTTIFLFYICTAIGFAQSIELYSPLYFTYSNLVGWRMLESQIGNPNYNPILIHWTGHGGHVSMGADFVNKVLNAEYRGKRITFNVEGYAYSEHANVLCYVPNVRMNSATIIWHAATIDGYYSNSYDIVNQENDIFNHCINKGYLTENQKSAIIYGHKAVRLQYGRTEIIPDIKRQ